MCTSCELGLLLTAGADVAPSPGAAFIVIDSSMSVCAVSGPAETLLAVSETDAVNRHLTELVVPADAEASGPQNLAVLRHMAINVMQKDTCKGSLRGKFKRAGWNNDYLASLLALF